MLPPFPQRGTFNGFAVSVFGRLRRADQKFKASLCCTVSLRLVKNQREYTGHILNYCVSVLITCTAHVTKHTDFREKGFGFLFFGFFFDFCFVLFLFFVVGWQLEDTVHLGRVGRG